MTTKKTILITGATGSVSTTVLAALKDSGHSVRALVRDAVKGAALESHGIEVRMGDLERPRTLGAAFAGADTVWVLAAPGPRAPEQCSNALWAARQAGAKHVVRMSAFGAAHDAPTINSRLHALSDAELAASKIPYTILKPHFFMQNLMMAARTVADQGTIYMALGDGKLGMIDLRDIGEFAARVLTSDGHEGRTYTLTGPASITMQDVAAALAESLGKPVTYTSITPATAELAMAQMGASEWMVTSLGDYFTAYTNNWGDHVSEDFQQVMGRPPRSIADFARDSAAAFGKR